MAYRAFNRWLFREAKEKDPQILMDLIQDVLHYCDVCLTYGSDSIDIEPLGHKLILWVLGRDEGERYFNLEDDTGPPLKGKD